MRNTTYNTRTRARNRKADIQVMLIATDDFGDMALAKCDMSGEVFPAMQGIVRGATMPNVNAAFLHSPNSAEAWKENLRLFHESEANCNTCSQLIRRQSDRTDGFLDGECRLSGKKISFHPDDPMHMDCYQSRYGADNA